MTENKLPEFTSLQELWSWLQEEAEKKIKERAKSNPKRDAGGSVA